MFTEELLVWVVAFLGVVLSGMTGKGVPGSADFRNVALVPHGVPQMEQGWCGGGKVSTPSVNNQRPHVARHMHGFKEKPSKHRRRKLTARSLVPDVCAKVVEAAKCLVEHFAETAASG